MSDFRFQPGRWIARLLAPLDGPLVSIVLAILSFSTIVMVSASPERLDTLALNIAVAFTVMWVAASIPPQRMMTVALPLYVLGVLLLIGVALFGDVSKGARRWLNIGVARIQPSELMKIAMPLMLAWYFQSREGLIRVRDFFIAVLGAPGQRALAALRVQLALGVLQLLLQARELRGQRPHVGRGLVEQHDAQHADHLARGVAQRDAADHEGARLVAQQVDQDRLAGAQHLVHLRVVHHPGHRLADEVLLARKAQRGQKAPVLLVDPDHARVAVDQQHALAGVLEQLEHRARGQRQDALAVAGQGGGRCGHGAMVVRAVGNKYPGKII